MNRDFMLLEKLTKKKLFIAFTVRKDQIRVISARDMSQKEREVYESL